MLQRCVEQRAGVHAIAAWAGPVLQRAWYTNPLHTPGTGEPSADVAAFLEAVKANNSAGAKHALLALRPLSASGGEPSNADESAWARAVREHLEYLEASPTAAMASFQRLYFRIAPAYAPDFDESRETKERRQHYDRLGRRRVGKPRSPAFDAARTKEIQDNFVWGDLFYGLATARDRYISALVGSDYDLHTPGFDPDAMRLRMPSRPPLIVDTISNTFMGTGAVGTRAAAHFYGVSGADYREREHATKRYEGRYDQEHPWTRDFREFLESDPRRDPRKSPEDSDAQMNLRIGRSSKGGIAFTLMRGGRVHFLLDDDTRGPLDIGRILNDAVAAPNSQRGITGKELRWIFRNRLEIGDRVFFWKDGTRCRPPWEQDPGPWKLYQEHSEQKHASRARPPRVHVTAPRHRGIRLPKGEVIKLTD